MAYMTKSLDNEINLLLKKGGIGVLPTDTIYGLSAAALNEDAVKKVYKLKGRSAAKPFIILISNIKMLDLLSIAGDKFESVLKYWPGSLTVIFDAPQAPAWLHAGTGTLAVRQPGDKDLRKFINKCGPIISTSVNIQGAIPASSIKMAIDYFGDNLDFYVNVGRLESLPSTLAKLVDGRLEVIRKGAVNITTER